MANVVEGSCMLIIHYVHVARWQCALYSPKIEHCFLRSLHK